MTGKHNSLLQKIRNVQGDQKILDVGCPCHLAHLCAGNGAKELSVNVEDFVIFFTITFTGVQNEKTS